MIVVRIELWPGGDPRPLRQIAILGIANVGPGVGSTHVYEARAAGRIARLSHDRADGALALVAQAIDALARGSQPDPLARRRHDPDLATLAGADGSSDVDGARDREAGP